MEPKVCDIVRNGKNSQRLSKLVEKHKKMALCRTAPATVGPFWTVPVTKIRVPERRHTERGRANALLASPGYALSHTLMNLLQIPALFVASLIMYRTLGYQIYCQNKD